MKNIDTEKKLQNYLKSECKRRKIKYYKFASPSKRGVPDVILVHSMEQYNNMPDRVCFVELKSPSGKGKLSELQLSEIAELRDIGASVYVLDSVEKVNNLMILLTDVEKW